MKILLFLNNLNRFLQNPTAGNYSLTSIDQLFNILAQGKPLEDHFFPFLRGFPTG